ncbi:hypothetical protein [Vibrio campbellii]|uniref:hypothetical protein n=1 Tax=Vibrio campbellii TaxID=680 RepID=UPI000CD368EF|nr:hypothetical protein [Vibrio campbellii]AUW04804.1 hypothetical protein C1N51_14495 [Vibrio campbellii]
MERFSWLPNNPSWSVERILIKSAKWFRNVSCTIVFVISFPVTSSDNVVESDYQLLSSQYNEYYQKGKYKEAFQISIKQLNMDPSDSVAFLRLALSVRGSCNLVKPYFSQFGSMNQFREVTLLAKGVILKECAINL